MLGTSWWN